MQMKIRPLLLMIRYLLLIMKEATQFVPIYQTLTRIVAILTR